MHDCICSVLIKNSFRIPPNAIQDEMKLWLCIMISPHITYPMVYYLCNQGKHSFDSSSKWWVPTLHDALFSQKLDHWLIISHVNWGREKFANYLPPRFLEQKHRLLDTHLICSLKYSYLHLPSSQSENDWTIPSVWKCPWLFSWWLVTIATIGGMDGWLKQPYIYNYMNGFKYAWCTFIHLTFSLIYSYICEIVTRVEGMFKDTSPKVILLRVACICPICYQNHPWTCKFLFPFQILH